MLTSRASLPSPPHPQASYGVLVSIVTAESPLLTPKMLRASCPQLPCICHTIFYQTCKPSGMLQALNFYEILGPVIIRQTEKLVTDSSPLADAKASQHDAWFPQGQPSSGAVEIDEDGTYPGEISMQEQWGWGRGCAEHQGALCPTSTSPQSPTKPSFLPGLALHCVSSRKVVYCEEVVTVSLSALIQ